MSTERTIRPRRQRPAAASFALLLTIATQAVGQKQPALPADHPDVYYSFFFFMEGFGKWLDLHATQAPNKQAALMASAARYLKVDVKELPALISSCESVAANLRQITDDAHQFWASESAKGKPPDPATMRSFEAKRQAAIQDGINQMQQTLSPLSWSGVHSHINGTHRAMIHTLN